MNHRNIDEGFGRRYGMLIVFTESAKAAEPGEGAFDDPASGQQFEVMQRRRVFDDFQSEPTPRPKSAHPFDQPASVAAVRPDAAQPAEAVTQGREKQARSIAILNIGRVDADQQDQSQGIDQKMSLSSHHLLASIVSTNSALLSCAHTLRVEDRSRGGFFLPAWSRTASRSASFSRAQIPCFFQWAK